MTKLTNTYFVLATMTLNENKHLLIALNYLQAKDKD